MNQPKLEPGHRPAQLIPRSARANRKKLLALSGILKATCVPPYKFLAGDETAPDVEAERAGD